MPDQAVARHFEQAAARYSRLRGGGFLGWVRSREQAAVQVLTDVSPGHLVLDAGCGDGATLDWLRARGARTVGIDLTWPMALVSSKRGFETAVQDMEKLGLRPLFDLVMCIGSLEFVPDPARAVSNLASCLAPDGRLVLLFPRRGPLGFLYSLYHRTHGARIHLFDFADIEQMFENAGLAPPQTRRDCLLSSVCTTSRVAETEP